MDNKYFHVVFTLNQTLNSLKNKHILSNLQNFFLFWQTFFILTKFSQFFSWIWVLILILTDICLWLRQLSKISKNRCVCLEITDKYLNLSVILLFTFALRKYLFILHQSGHLPCRKSYQFLTLCWVIGPPFANIINKIPPGEITRLTLIL